MNHSVPQFSLCSRGHRATRANGSRFWLAADLFAKTPGFRRAPLLGRSSSWLRPLNLQKKQNRSTAKSSATSPRLHLRVWAWVWMALVLPVLTVGAQTTNTNSLSSFSLPRPAMQDVGSSLVRVMIALTIVIAVFLGIVWLLRNWQRLMIRHGRAPRLNVLEARSLGGRQAIYVVGYDQERFLIGSSSAGIQLLSHLPSADPKSAEESPAAPVPGQKMSFAQALSRVLKGGK